MSTTSLIKKLRLLPGARVLILSPPQWYLETLQAKHSETIDTVAIGDDKYDFVHLFVWDSDEFNALLPAALKANKYDGIFWLSYPKKSSGVATDLSRDVFWDLMANSGLRPVTQISIDEIWSALRFRPAEKVGR